MYLLERLAAGDLVTGKLLLHAMVSSSVELFRPVDGRRLTTAAAFMQQLLRAAHALAPQSRGACQIC